MGKLTSAELKKLLSCIKKDPRVLVPPQVGFDAGVHRIGDKYLAVATDPCTGVPEEWFGWLLVNYAASDLALCGAKPEFCTITLMGPRQTQPQTFQEVMTQTCNAADELHMAIVRGHTGTYDSLTELVGVCTACGTVQLEKLKTPANAKQNDLILITKPLGLETAVNFALTCKAQAQKLFGKEKAKLLTEQIRMQSCVQEATQLAELHGVHAMHDATEGGFAAAINELGEASDLGFEVNFGKLPITQEVQQLQETFQLSDAQVLAMSSTGTILAAVDPDDTEKVEETLKQNNLTANFVGKFTQNKTRLLTKQGKTATFPAAIEDPYAMILSGKV